MLRILKCKVIYVFPFPAWVESFSIDCFLFGGTRIFQRIFEVVTKNLPLPLALLSLLLANKWLRCSTRNQIRQKANNINNKNFCINLARWLPRSPLPRVLPIWFMAPKVAHVSSVQPSCHLPSPVAHCLHTLLTVGDKVKQHKKKKKQISALYNCECIFHGT